MPNKFKVGDKVRIKVLDNYRWGTGYARMKEAIQSRTVCTVAQVVRGVDVRLEEVHNWSIHEDEIESYRKPIVIITE